MNFNLNKTRINVENLPPTPSIAQLIKTQQKMTNRA